MKVPAPTTSQWTCVRVKVGGKTLTTTTASSRSMQTRPSGWPGGSFGGPIRSDSIQLPTNELPTAPYRLLLLDHFASLVRSTGDFPSTLVHIWPAAPKKKKRVTFIAQAQIPKNAAGRLGHRGKLLSLFRPLMCVECRVPKERGKMKKGWPRLGPHAHTCTCSRHVLRNTSICKSIRQLGNANNHSPYLWG